MNLGSIPTAAYQRPKNPIYIVLDSECDDSTEEATIHQHQNKPTAG
jgi:riboflavin biosynthesis pyrimidine reductase